MNFYVTQSFTRTTKNANYISFIKFCYVWNNFRANYLSWIIQKLSEIDFGSLKKKKEKGIKINSGQLYVSRLASGLNVIFELSKFQSNFK